MFYADCGDPYLKMMKRERPEKKRKNQQSRIMNIKQAETDN
jgi:hypothetical protein